jgi:hypothetical protein
MRKMSCLVGILVAVSLLLSLSPSTLPASASNSPPDHTAVASSPVDVALGGTQPGAAEGNDAVNDFITGLTFHSNMDAGSVDHSELFTAQDTAGATGYLGAASNSTPGNAAVNIVAGVLDHIVVTPSPADVVAGGTQ